jgi:hypothetical protein
MTQALGVFAIASIISGFLVCLSIAACHRVAVSWHDRPKHWIGKSAKNARQRKQGRSY